MMKVKVYQANIEWNNKFMSYDFVMTHGGIDRNEYNCVFDGELPVSNLEAIYMILNTSRPEGYNGHSLSVSDIIIVDGIAYFVDSFGFEEIDNF